MTVGAAVAKLVAFKGASREGIKVNAHGAVSIPWVMIDDLVSNARGCLKLLEGFVPPKRKHCWSSPLWVVSSNFLELP